MLQTAIILAGGYGTRLQSIVSDVPKPMAPVDGEPFLNYQLYYLKQAGIKKVLLSVGHLSEKIKTYYGNAFKGMAVDYVKEETPLGTGGGIRLAMEQCSDDEALVLNGDSFFETDLPEFYKLHKNGAADCSLALRHVTNAARYGTIQLNQQHRIVSFKEKSETTAPGLINGGVYILNKKLYLSSTRAGKNFSIENDFFAAKVSQLNIKGFEFNGYFIDIGIPEDYLKAQHDFKGFKYR
jgi:D-glycero-alpha-D-manno-heptose 1-phosphate guanylyltransferase